MTTIPVQYVLDPEVAGPLDTRVVGTSTDRPTGTQLYTGLWRYETDGTPGWVYYDGSSWQPVTLLNTGQYWLTTGDKTLNLGSGSLYIDIGLLGVGDICIGGGLSSTLRSINMFSSTGGYASLSIGELDNTTRFGMTSANYFTSQGVPVAIGTETNHSLFFGTNDVERVEINTSGAIAFSGSFGNSGQVLQSGGQNAAPTWVNPSGGTTLPSYSFTNSQKPILALTAASTYKWQRLNAGSNVSISENADDYTINVSLPSTLCYTNSSHTITGVWTFSGNHTYIQKELRINNGNGTATHFNYSAGGSQNYIRGTLLHLDTDWTYATQPMQVTGSASGLFSLDGKITNWAGLVGQKYNGYYSDNLSFGQSASGFWRDAYKMGQSRRYLQISIGDEGSNYSYMWFGWVVPHTAGTYSFWTSSDDASHVQIDGSTIVNNGGTHGNQARSGSTYMNAKQWYEIRIVYGEASGGASMGFQWYGPDSGYSWTYNLYTSTGTFRCVCNDA